MGNLPGFVMAQQPAAAGSCEPVPAAAVLLLLACLPARAAAWLSEKHTDHVAFLGGFCCFDVCLALALQHANPKVGFQMHVCMRKACVGGASGAICTCRLRTCLVL